MTNSLLLKKKAKMMASTNVNLSNTPFLVIVESPSKCPKIEKFLGFQYKCIASKGHIRELVKVGTLKQHYDPTYEIISEKRSHVEWMKSIISQFSPTNVFLGTDDDREGEAIAWHICKVCNLNVETTKRILFNEITKPALVKAVQTPTYTRMNIVHAQQARQVLDRMIGFKISPYLSKFVPHDSQKYLSAGRCQTPTLRLIYDKFSSSHDKETSVQYKVRGIFFPDPSSLQFNLSKPFSNENTIVEFLEDSKKFSHIFHVQKTVEKNSISPKPFNTSNLLQHASSNLGISPKKVMDCCQTLYQDGYITYMRTDSKKYSMEFLKNQMNDFIGDEYGSDYLGDFNTISIQDNQNPHEAIRVTNLKTHSVEYDDNKVIAVYRVIWKRTVESCMSVYQYKEHKFTIDAPHDLLYNTSVEEGVFLGWKRVNTTINQHNDQLTELHRKMNMWKRYDNKHIQYEKIESTLSVTNQETHYQESGLVQALEKLGIGRPSTYSMLVDVIQQRAYVKKEDIEGIEYKFNEYTLVQHDDKLRIKPVEKTFGSSKNQLCIKPIGIQSIDFLYQHFPSLFDYEYTKHMENQLDELINNIDLEWYKVCEECEKTIKKSISPIQQKMKQAYSLDDTHELIFGKNGAVIRIKDTKTYKSVKKNVLLDFEKLENGSMTYNDLVELPEGSLGKYDNEDIFVKKGPYGAYVQWGEKRENIEKLIRKVKIPLTSITLDIIAPFLDDCKNKLPPSVLRILDETMSVRKGKNRASNYIFYKTESMNKPSFINIRKCPLNVITDDPELIIKWAMETLNK